MTGKTEVFARKLGAEDHQRNMIAWLTPASNPGVQLGAGAAAVLLPRLQVLTLEKKNKKDRSWSLQKYLVKFRLPCAHERKKHGVIADFYV